MSVAYCYGPTCLDRQVWSSLNRSTLLPFHGHILDTSHCSSFMIITAVCLDIWFEPTHDKTNKVACAPNEVSDQPGHPPSLIRVFAVRMKKAWILSYPLSAQRRLWSDWADAQADLSLRWAHVPFCWFCHEVAHFFIVMVWHRTSTSVKQIRRVFEDNLGIIFVISP